MINRKPTMSIYRKSGYQKRTAPICRAEKICFLCAPALLLLVLAAVFFARLNSGWVERYYSLGFYPFWAGGLSFVTARLHFSLAEVIIIAFSLLCIAAVGFLIAALIKGGGNRIRISLRFFMRAFSVAMAILLLFLMGGGLNYYRESFTLYSGLEVRPSEVSQLTTLCRELVNDANATRDKLTEDEAGVVTFSPRTPWELSAEANTAYSALTAQYPQWKALFSLAEKVPPKPVHFSEAMSYMQIVGFFFPYTIEANVNVHTSDFDIPSSMCHELAHIAGFMREDEANFIAYLACRSSNDAFFRYSGTMLALIHSTNALYSVNTAAYNDVITKLSPAVMRDMSADSAYYRKYDTKFGDFADSVNDTYLKVNNQQDGVAGYGRMVDLLLADFRSRNNIT